MCNISAFSLGKRKNLIENNEDTKHNIRQLNLEEEGEEEAHE